MIIKMQITFDYNPETNEYKPIKQEIIKETTTKKVVKKEESSDPLITLSESKISINEAAKALIGIDTGDRVEIKYQVLDKINYPIIGKNTAWNSENGNKLTKSNTISCRGTANSLLCEFGTEFTLSAWDGHPGLFLMLGNKERSVVDENIEITEDSNEGSDFDIDKDFVTKEDETGIDNSDFEDFEEENFELNNFNFNFD